MTGKMKLDSLILNKDDYYRDFFFFLPHIILLTSILASINFDDTNLFQKKRSSAYKRKEVNYDVFLFT
jgi:hypothetical protein